MNDKESSLKSNRKKTIKIIDNALKRAFDFTASAIGMIVFSPLYLAIWLSIKLDSKGPAVFRQERIGYKGRPFTLYKFRSMEITSEQDGVPALCRQNDDRLTRVGRFIRTHHLDELPQFWNVFKGEMSFVGPRPERQYFIDQIMERNPDYALLYQLRPGLFSYATLYNGYTGDMEKMLKRLEYDLDYLEHHNIWIDFKIIWLTAVYIFSGKKF